MIYGADADEIGLPALVNTLPLVGTDRYLHEMLVQYAEEALANRTPERTSVRSKVEHVIGPLLPHGKSQGVNHRQGARRQPSHPCSACWPPKDKPSPGYWIRTRPISQSRILTHGDLSISQIAWLLGYREVSTFTHASSSVGMASRPLNCVRA